MLVALVAVGVVLIVFGCFVLLRFPDRPGGEFEFQGVKIHSVGAGLPLIVMGLVAVVLAVLQGTREPEPVASGPSTVPSESVSAVAPSGGGPSGTTASASPQSCLDAHLAKEPAVQPGIWTRLPEGETASVVGSPAALILSRGTEVTGAVRLQYFPIGDPTLTVLDIVDGSCQPGTSTVTKVSNGFVVSLTLPDRHYELTVTYVPSRAVPTATLAVKPLT